MGRVTLPGSLEARILISEDVCSIVNSHLIPLFHRLFKPTSYHIYNFSTISSPPTHIFILHPSFLLSYCTIILFVPTDSYISILDFKKPNARFKAFMTFSVTLSYVLFVIFKDFLALIEKQVLSINLMALGIRVLLCGDCLWKAR